MAIAAALLVLAASAQAQAYTVTNLSDTGVSGDGSLRGELAAANANPGADTVVFAPGLSGTITLSGEGLQIEDAVDIQGPGPSQLTVSQSSPTHRVIHIELNSSGPVTIAGLHLANGTTTGPGGDIQNDYEGEVATLTVSNCLVTGGTASDYGGGIDSFGAPLILRSSTVSGNRATSGGGLWVGGENIPFTIENSTIAGNSAPNGGGGITGEVESSGHSEIVGSTISGNFAGFNGGGAILSIDSGPTLTVSNSTIAGNTTEEGGGGLEISSSAESTTIEDSTIAGNHSTGTGLRAGGLQAFGSGTQKLVDTIVAGNTSSGEAPDLAGPWATAFSLIGNPAGATLTESVPGSNLIGVDPQLAPLADNGGPTQTMALPPTSPAVNKGSGSLSTDQRGDTRPVLYPGVPISAAPGANGADIGAYELQAPPMAAPTASPSPTLPAAWHRKRKHPPRVRIGCPRTAAPGGCHFTLQAFSARPHRATGKGKRSRPEKPVAESLVTRVNVRAGRRAKPTLTPKPMFAARLEAAKSLLVREVETIAGKPDVSYRRMNVVR